MAEKGVASDAHGMAAPFTYSRYLSRQLKIAESDPTLFRTNGNGNGVENGEAESGEEAEEPLVVPRDVEAYIGIDPIHHDLAVDDNGHAYMYAPDTHMTDIPNHVHPHPHQHGHQMPMSISAAAGTAGPASARWSPSDLSPVSPVETQLASVGRGGGPYSALDFSFEGFLQNVGAGSGAPHVAVPPTPVSHPGTAATHQGYTGMTPPPSSAHTGYSQSPMAGPGHVPGHGHGGGVETDAPWWASMMMGHGAGPVPGPGLVGPGMNGAQGEWSPTMDNAMNGYSQVHPHAHHDDYGGGYQRGY